MYRQSLLIRDLKTLFGDIASGLTTKMPQIFKHNFPVEQDVNSVYKNSLMQPYDEKVHLLYFTIFTKILMVLKSFMCVESSNKVQMVVLK